MKIDKLFVDKNYLEQEIEFFIKKKHIFKISSNNELVHSYLKKAKHNFNFYKINKNNREFNDWLIVILYYSIYHCALALITNKKYASKNHYATILILIKEYGITKIEADLINKLSINKDDAKLYTNLKEYRHNASYQINNLFNETTIFTYEKQVLEFIQKTEDILTK
jgi:uncharacterized protein (UPF0332 family)